MSIRLPFFIFFLFTFFVADVLAADLLQDSSGEQYHATVGEHNSITLDSSTSESSYKIIREGQTVGWIGLSRQTNMMVYWLINLSDEESVFSIGCNSLLASKNTHRLSAQEAIKSALYDSQPCDTNNISVKVELQGIHTGTIPER